MRNFRRVGFLSVSLALGLAASAQQSDVAPATAPTGRVVTGIVVPPSGGNTNASVQLFNNGTWITQTGVGVGGADVSEIESGLNTYGLNVTQNVARLADDFTVPAATNWNLTDMKWRSYMTNGGTGTNYTGATVQIWNGPPPGGTVVAGDLTTNRYMSHAFSNVYRTTAGNFGDTARAVIDVKVNMSWVPPLGPGTYFVDIAVTGSGGASGPWTNVTVPWDAQDNGHQFFGGAWNITTFGQVGSPCDFPYELEGNTGCTGSVSVFCTSKVNSAGCTPAIGSTGSPSASAGSGFVIATTNDLDNKFGLFFYSKTGPNSSPFQGGFLCGAPPLTRTSVQSSGGTPPCNGAYSIDFNTYIASGKDPALVSGQAVWLQKWSRDPASPSTTNLSDAITFTICP
jgi:hypothetical protein